MAKNGTKETPVELLETAEGELSEREQREQSENPDDRIAYDFAADWRTNYKRESPEILDGYIKKEIQRLIDGGYAVLTSILQLHSQRDVLPRTTALTMLRSDSDFSADYAVIALALIPAQFRQDAVPIHDYNGALVPEPRRGKVLAAKVCGGWHKDIASHGESKAAEEIRAAKYNGPAFATNQLRASRMYGMKGAPYYCVEIGDKPKVFPLDEAISIMERYGHGVAQSRVGKKGLWLIREVKLG